MKKALIFDAYDDYNIRIRYIEKALRRNGYDVDIFFADFDHVRKEYYQNKLIGVKYIHVDKYDKNLSYARIKSHANFAKACIEEAEKHNDVSIIYCMVPPNSMVKEFSKYKETHPNVKIWFDVLDMWPETLPASPLVKFFGTPAFSLWRNTRNDNLNSADIITTECNLFKNELKDCADENKIQTIYLCQPERFIKDVPSLNNGIHFLYCGSINNIVDINLMITYLNDVNLNNKITVDIIGDGENRETFLNKLKKHNISYNYHGIVYDELKKREIYSKIHFGLNIMKDSVFVGLTMKSLEYMSHGIPIINNIKADTYDLVENENIGFNLDRNMVHTCINRTYLATDKFYKEIRKNTMDVFEELFTEKRIDEQLDEVIKKLEGNS